MPTSPIGFTGNPLASDDRYLNTQDIGFSGRPGASAGLDLGGNPTSPMGLRGMPAMPNVNADMQAIGQLVQPTVQAPVQPQGPQMYYSPSSGEMVVNGFQFNQRNASQALASEEWARQPARQFTLPDTANDWRPMSAPEYTSYLDTIRNPSYGRRMGEAWEHAWRGVGDTAIGAGLAAAEATGNEWEWGQVAHNNLVREYEENAPFMLQLRDVRDPGDAMTYASQMLIQAAPWLVETIVSMAVGGVVGGAVSGGLGAVPGAVEGVLVKEAIRRAVMQGVRQNLTRGAAAYRAAMASSGGATVTREAAIEAAARVGASADDVNRFFNFGERAYHLSRGARGGEGVGGLMGSTGALTGAGASNYAAAVGDIRNSIQDAGGDPTTAESIGNIWGMAIPYAAIESVGDLILTQPLTKIFPNLIGGPSRVGNIARGAGLNFLSESVQEGSQLGITEYAADTATDQDFNVEPIDLLEAMVGGGLGGAGVGGVMGAFERPTPRTGPALTPPPAAAVTPTPPPEPYDPAGIADSSTPNVQDEYGVTPYMGNEAYEEPGLTPEPPPAYPTPEPLPPSTMPDYSVPLRVGMEEELPPGLAGTDRPARSRHPVEIFQDLYDGLDVEPREIMVLRNAIQDLIRQDPTGPNVTGYTNVLSQIGYGHPITNTEPDNRLDSAPAFDQTPVQASQPAPRAGPIAQNGNPIDKSKLKPAVRLGPDGKPITDTPPVFDVGDIQPTDDYGYRANDEFIEEPAEDQKARFAALEKKTLLEDLDTVTDAEIAEMEALRKVLYPNRPAISRAFLREADDYANQPEDGEDMSVPEMARIRKSLDAGAASVNENIPHIDLDKLKKPNRRKQRYEAEQRKLADEKLKRQGKFRSGDMIVEPIKDDSPEPTKTPSRNRIKEAAARAKEARDAPKERSTESVAPEKQAGRLKATRKINPNVETTAGQNANKAGTEGVQGTTVDQAKVDEARATLLDLMVKRKKPNPTVSARNSVSSVLLHLGKGNKLSDDTKWAHALNEAELRALYTSLEDTHRDAAVAEHKARGIGRDLSKWRKDFGDDKLHEFVNSNRREVQAWMVSADANEKAGLRLLVKAILEAPPREPPKRATVARKAEANLRHRQLWNLLKEVKLDEDGSLPADWREQVIAASNGVFRKSYEIAATLKGLLATDTPEATAARALFRRDKPQRSAPSTPATGEALDKAEVAKLVKQVQARIHESARFTTTHVFKDIQDLFARANTEMMTAPNGAQHSIGQHIMREVQLLKLEDSALKEWTDAQIAAVWVEEQLMSRAVVVNPYNALIVFADNAETERHLLETLEHEYVVHGVLRAIFPNAEDRNAFLWRVSQLPGMEAKRKELVQKYKQYAALDIFSQTEEVLAFHSMEGPLALEKLLSAKEGIDTATRRTLWEELKQVVMDWVRRVFGGLRQTEDQVLDALISGLREHAITGSTKDLNRVIFDMTVSEIPKLDPLVLQAINDDKLKRAVAGATPTPKETAAILFGTDTNPGQPYTPVNWYDDVGRRIKDNAPLVEKLKELGSKNVGTSVREAVRKIGRNIEPMNYMALRSTLIEKMMDAMDNTIQTARFIMSKIQENRPHASKDAGTARARALFGDKAPGSTQEQRDAYNKMAVVATNNLLAQASDEVVRGSARLLVHGEDGIYRIPKDINGRSAVFEAMLVLGTLTKEQFKAGVDQFTVSGDGKLSPAGKAKLSDEVIEAGYDIYEKESRLMAESMLTTLEHAAIMLNQMNDLTVAKLVRANQFDEGDQAFVNDMLHRMYKLYSDIAFHNYTGHNRLSRFKQKDKARQVLTELMRTMHAKEKLEDWLDASKKPSEKNKSPRKQSAFKWREITDPADDVKPFVDQIRWFLENDRLQKMHDIYTAKFGTKGKRQFDMLGAFQGMLNADSLIREHENRTIQSILGNYVEFTRKGEWRVFVTVVHAGKKDKQGKPIPVDVDDELYSVLPVTYTPSQREAQELQAARALALEGTFTINDGEGNPIEVEFDIGYEKAPGIATLSEGPSVKEFIEIANVINLKLSAPQMKEIANLIENAEGRKRLGLQRASTPGMDSNILQNNSETMTRRAWWAAKMSQSWMIKDIFQDERNVYGDPEHLKLLQREFDIANRGAPEGEPVPTSFVRNEAAVWLAETALVRYANQMRYMSRHTLGNPNIVIRTTKGEQKFKIEPEAQAHLQHANALMESLEKGTLELNLNDLLSKTGGLRMAAVVAQLGSMAAGVMNAFSIGTHLPHVLMGHHEGTAYGEGFGLSEVMPEIGRAIKQVFNPLRNMDDSAKMKELLDEAKAGKNSTTITVEELEALYQMTLVGLLMPQQTYSLTGGTESNITNLFLRNAAEVLLRPFGAIEAANRRVSALVAYRLIKKRYIDSGVSAEALADPTSPEHKQLLADVKRVVDFSQGYYANINRPKAFRGDLSQFVMMYKMFPLMTTMMLYNLPYKQQTAFLAVLFLLGGLKGEPYADDFMDVYDTLLQKLGVPHDSVELQLTQFFEDIMPGSSTWIMHGFIDNLAFGGTMSSRIAMGDIIPLTGAFRDGADMNREIIQAFGPAAAANVAIVEWAALLADYTLQATGLKAQTTNWREIIRKLPQSQLRGIGEAGLMALDGEITDPQGRLTSDEVNFYNIMSRAIGFYPLEATKANTAVRLDRMHTNYIRAIRARFILAYANAHRSDDRDTMENIDREVNDWNEAARMSGQDDMLISDFRSAALRASRAASQTTIERTASSAPDYSLLEELAGILEADEESDD